MCIDKSGSCGFPRERREARVQEYVHLMNYWYAEPHRDYDRRSLCFIEISDSREHDGGDGVEEPRPGSVIRVVDSPTLPEENARQQDKATCEGEVCAVAQYSEQDLQYAAELRAEIHREALAIVRKTRPEIKEVIDRHPAEDYFQEHWDYPGRWYTIVAIPEGYASRQALVDSIVAATLAGHAPAEDVPYVQMLRDTLTRLRRANSLGGKPAGYRELFTVEPDRKTRRASAVGTDGEGRYILETYAEYADGDAVGSTGAYSVLTELEYGRLVRLALLNGSLTDEEYDRLTAKPEKPQPDGDPFYRLIAEYPALAVEYRIVKNGRDDHGYEAHRAALKTAFDSLGGDWEGDPAKAMGKRVDAEEQFSSHYQKGTLNYRKAFLYPPHGSGCSGKDFARVNAALFPNGTDALEVFAWTTDWSDYFDDGREWWGTLCLTVYDGTLDRFAVILASATD